MPDFPVPDDDPAASESTANALEQARREVFRLRIEGAGGTGWSPRMRQRFGYFTPDEWYEAAMYGIVRKGTAWLDVGCGREPLPGNPLLGKLLSDRCRLLVGIDPDRNIFENTVVHERECCKIEDYHTDKTFDVISFRMVAEHIDDPGATLRAIDRLTPAGGRVVIYTVSKWSPASLAAAATPMFVHHLVKKALWESAPRDTFPTAYRMNTRKTLKSLFDSSGFSEEHFFFLNDCRSFSRWRATAFLELSAERAFRGLGLPYPERCLLGIYRKRA